MVGLETALSVVVESVVKNGLMNWETLVTRMSTAPAKIAGYEDHYGIAVGNPANLTIVNPNAQWKVDRSKLISRSSNTPFHEMVLPGVIVHTFYRGVHVLQDGRLTGMKYE